MKKNYAKAARQLGFKKSFFHRLIHCNRNLKYPAAKKFAKQIGSKPEIWLQGEGTPESRWNAVAHIIED
jgi:plasmid maintenance system antidote protein VapI